MVKLYTDEEYSDWVEKLKTMRISLDDLPVIWSNPKSQEAAQAIYFNARYGIDGIMLVDMVHEYLDLIEKYIDRRKQQSADYQQYLKLKAQFEPK